jgi:hypothetical protein
MTPSAVSFGLRQYVARIAEMRSLELQIDGAHFQERGNAGNHVGAGHPRARHLVVSRWALQSHIWEPIALPGR